ncbi:HAAS signaling domain-containing protein [Micromonospora sp. NPDC002575]|uniref:HAAS signaling domain-containing protein n=1 Tax=Micromonospora sp. NPDC002575 TaxID=3364222 RepID=UPI0036A60762
MTVMEQEIADYVTRVRAALADLPPHVRDELTEDLPEHLAEVAAEADGSLVDRLGAPEAYAAELRAAAGAGGPAAARNLDQRAAAALAGVRARLRAADVRVGPILGYASASEYLRLLRPAWWVLRGYLAAMLITVVTTGVPFGLLPRLGGSLLAALLLLGVCVVASVWLGRRTAALTRWPRIALRAGTAILAVFAFVGFVDADDRLGWNESGYESTSVESPYVGDIFVYDSEGRLVEDARLFDQNGNPIRIGYPMCERAELPEPGRAPVYPYCPENAPFQAGPVGARPAPAVPPGTPPLTDSATPTPSDGAVPGPPAPTPTDGTPPVPPAPTPTGEPASGRAPAPAPPGEPASGPAPAPAPPGEPASGPAPAPAPPGEATLGPLPTGTPTR